MTLQQVKLGTPPAGSDGDDPRTAFTRINSNFKAIDDMGLTGPVVANREVANLNDASGPGKWIGTAAATNRPAGFTRSSIEVVQEVSGDLIQQATDKATGQIANRVYTASTDAWSAWVIIGSGGGPGPEILPIASGGTGADTAAGARTNLGLKALATEDVAPVAGGGTGATNAAQARANLGLTNAASAFAGATSGTAGTPGLVPAPAAGDQAKVLSASGEWVPMAARFFGEMVMLPNRQNSPDGVPKADGQWINNATAQHPHVVADLQSSTPSVPVTTAANWEADPLSRVCWVWDAANDRIRLPDWNGMQPGSIGPLMFRGDGTLGFAPGKARRDQMQGHYHGSTYASLITSTPFTAGAQSVVLQGSGSSSTFANTPITDGANGAPRIGTETFGKHGVGVWGVVLFGAVSNPGAADAAALATSYANQQAAITSLQGKPGFARYVSADIAVSYGSYSNLAHGLGVKPDHCFVALKCVTSEFGYSVGEELQLSPTRASYGSSPILELSPLVSYNTTNVTMRQPDGIVVPNKTTGAIVAATSANWRLVVRAYA